MKYIKDFSINEGKDKSVSFSTHFWIKEDTMFIYTLAKNSKQLDKLYGKDPLVITNKIAKVLEKNGLEVSWDSSNEGAGYWFRLLPNSVFKLIAKKELTIDV